jgi:glycosyltransferase involved in cell wall biosynthesis
MKVLLCHNYYQRPGGEDQVFHDERWLLEEHGHDVTVYTKHNDEIEAMSRARLVQDTFWNRTTYRELRDLIRWVRPDVMHCTNVFPLISPAAYSAARAVGVPIVQSLHNYRLHCANGYFLRDGRVCEDCVGKSFPWPAIRHACYRSSRMASTIVASMQAFHRLLGTWRERIDRFISCSQFACDKLIANGVPADRIVVKPNFVRPDRGAAQGDGDYAVFAGRLSPEKGIATLLDAWSRLPNPLPLKILGDGPLAEQVAEAARRDSRIQLLGWQPLDQVLKTFGAAKFLVMTSVWYETFGRTIIEAFSKGTPAIVSRLGAMAELVTDHETGMLFNPGDPADLVEKIQSLLSDPNELRHMRVRCRAEFEQKYTAEENYRQLIAIYQGVQPHATDRSLQYASMAPASA